MLLGSDRGRHAHDRRAGARAVHRHHRLCSVGPVGAACARLVRASSTDAGAGAGVPPRRRATPSRLTSPGPAVKPEPIVERRPESSGACRACCLAARPRRSRECRVDTHARAQGHGRNSPPVAFVFLGSRAVDESARGGKGRATMDRVQIFDTTLRDGEQSPGATMNVEEKLVIARQLEHLGVDVIEAGFAASSEGDFEAVRRVAAGGHEADRAVARAHARGRTSSARSRPSRRRSGPGIHIFIATSDIHLKHKLMMSRQDVLDAAVWAVDARQEAPRLRRVLGRGRVAQRSRLPGRGVRRRSSRRAPCVINVPDTTGYALPEEYGALFQHCSRERVPGGDRVIWSAHCHNDLGMAVANSLAAVAERRAPGRVHGERHRRARRQHGDGRDRHGASRRATTASGVETGIVTEQIYADEPPGLADHRARRSR